VPSDLAVVPDDQARTMNLSWTPDVASDLAGYFVYRRDLTAGGPPMLISGATPLVAPSFEDSNIAPGHKYAYSVSAVDQDGNRSARSPEVIESLNQ
jgi:fibronectin type 3 domain-containing protein